jgi:hypothetical protein
MLLCYFFPPIMSPIIGILLNGFPVSFPPPPVALPPLVALVALVSEGVCATMGTKVPMDPRISPEAKTIIAVIEVSFFIAIECRHIKL